MSKRSHPCPGLIMGSLQLSAAFLVRDSLGGSSSYCTVISNGLRHTGCMRAMPYFSGFLSGIGNWWQVCTCQMCVCTCACMCTLDPHPSHPLPHTVCVLARGSWRCSWLRLSIGVVGDRSWSSTLAGVSRWCVHALWSEACVGLYKVWSVYCTETLSRV